MNEFLQTVPEQPAENEPTPKEIVDFAWKEGLIDTEERNDMFEDDMEDILGNLYGIIIETGDDPDEVFKRWGIVAQEQENQ